ncbi:CRISPR-associated protein Csx16 [bacterium]|nr:CRISPR-associated protein Csx16 [bacterium]
MTTWFVTRHSGAREWAEEKGIHVDYVIDHFEPSRIALGDCVLGTLPVNLAAEICDRGGRYFHLSLDVPLQLRGKELTKDYMRECNARLEEYKIERIR